jgi:hypothetical protein
LLLRLEGVLAVLTLAHEALLRQAADFDLEVALALRLFAMKPLGEVVDRLRPLLGDQVRGPGPSL